MPSFLLADIRVINREKYNDYRVHFRDCVRRHGGRFLARGQEPEVIVGGWHPPRLILVEFADGDAPRRMMESAEYRDLELARGNCAMFDIVVVDGITGSRFSGGDKVPAYAIADARIVNRAAFDDYRARIDAPVRSHRGRYLALSEKVYTAAGNWAPTFLAIIEFPSRADAARAYAEPGYVEVRDDGNNAAMIDIVVLSGRSPDVPD